jgi:hypothetical protein
MGVLRKTKGSIFLIRSEVHVPSLLAMKRGRVHFAVSKSNTAADRQTMDHYSRALIDRRDNTHKYTHRKNDSTIKGTSNIHFNIEHEVFLASKHTVEWS